MNSYPTYSRDELRSLPEKTKIQNIDNIIQSFIHSLTNNASSGKTSYFYELKDTRNGQNGIGYVVNYTQLGAYPPSIIPTTEEIVSRIKVRFPGCNVEYVEEWVDSTPNNKTLRKGIRIDWS